MKLTNRLFLLLLLLGSLIGSCKSDQTVEELFEKAAKKEGKWRWIPIPGMSCRDGSSTGIGVRLNPDSKNLLIYMEGGGACFNLGTCTANPFSYGRTQFSGWKNTGLQLGIFNKKNENNPFRNWNAVYIPYCTGDVHSGTNPSADISAGYRNLNMTGYYNVSRVMEVLQAYFVDAPPAEVFLTGSSAGGYGVLANASQVAEAFSAAQLSVLDDSGPIFVDQEVQPDCLDSSWIANWKWFQPGDFETYTSGTYSTPIKSMYEYLSNKHPDVNFGLLSPLEDGVIRGFFGYGDRNCDPALDVAVKIKAEVYRAGLIHLRDSVLEKFPNWATYYVDSKGHTYNLIPKTLNSLEVDGVLFRDWLADLRAGTAEHVTEE